MDPPPSRAMSYHNPDRLLRRFSSMHRALTDTQVVVCVKIRPLNAIEVAASSTICTQVLGPGALSVQDDNVIGQARTFTLDAVVHADAPQSALYELTARNILTKVFKGFNGCIFAYGQTGAGKTYSMLGSNKDERSEEGIIPRTCRELFSRISQDNGKTYIVKGHFVEIYQEKIIDLMDSNDTTRSVSKLLIRHDKSPGGKGIYITGVRETIVRTTQQVLALLEEGTKRRTVGSTNMNATSSRSHAVLSLVISGQDVDDVEGFTKTVAKLHLVDLAGSERAKATGATGARLVEGASINKSLAALGNVVNSLTSKNRSHVPYRDSKLTRLLQDSLGGNAYTLMICCVSPASMNSAETLSSLRFAERTKKIQNRATINRDPKLARIVQLTEENQTLKAKIEILEHELQVMKDSILKKPSAYAKSTATVSPATSMSVGSKTKCCVIS